MKIERILFNEENRRSYIKKTLWNKKDDILNIYYKI